MKVSDGQKSDKFRLERRDAALKLEREALLAIENDAREILEGNLYLAQDKGRFYLNEKQDSVILAMRHLEKKDFRNEGYSKRARDGARAS